MRFATVLIPIMLLLCLILPTGLLAVLEYFEEMQKKSRVVA